MQMEKMRQSLHDDGHMSNCRLCNAEDSEKEPSEVLDRSKDRM